MEPFGCRFTPTVHGAVLLHTRQMLPEWEGHLTAEGGAHDTVPRGDNRWSDVLSTVQNFTCGRGYLRAVDVSSFCTLADGVSVQMIYCTDNGRFLQRVLVFSHREVPLRKWAGGDRTLSLPHGLYYTYLSSYCHFLFDR